jgi:molybdopterin converting factor small subunit
MITVELLFFAQLRETLGKHREVLELEEGHTIDQVVASLKSRAEWRDVASLPLTFAVNEQVVSGTHTLRDGERLAILTPVSGG